MASSTEQKKAIELGKRLAAHLAEKSNDDQTVRWMAFYIGEQIARAEHATGDAKAAVEKACFDSILALWKHRQEMPHGVRLFEKFESIMATLVRIDPEHPNPYYYNHLIRQRAAQKGERDELERWLHFIEGVDRLARTLVSSALTQAAERAATPDTRAWLETELGDAKVDIDLILGLVRLKRREVESEEERKLTHELASLDKFSRLADYLKAELRAKQAALATKRGAEQANEAESGQTDTGTSEALERRP